MSDKVKKYGLAFLAILLVSQTFLNIPFKVLAEGLQGSQTFIVNEIKVFENVETVQADKATEKKSYELQIDWSKNPEVDRPEDQVINIVLPEDLKGETTAEQPLNDADGENAGTYQFLSTGELQLRSSPEYAKSGNGQISIQVTVNENADLKESYIFLVDDKKYEAAVFRAEKSIQGTENEVVAVESQDNINQTAQRSNQSKAMIPKNENLITNFVMTIITTNGQQLVLENGQELEVDLDEMNAVSLEYGLTVPQDYLITNGETYTVQLPEIFSGREVVDQPITIDGTVVATYEIKNSELTVTFNDSVNNFDNAKMNVNISGSFKKEVYENKNESIVQVPYSEGNSFTATVKVKPQEYEGEDKKIAGTPYLFNDANEKVEVTRNPTHVDWTITANDDMQKINNAVIRDDLGEHLEIVKDSIVVYQIKRNYKNQEIDRIKVEVSPTFTGKGFDLNLGSIEDAYEITYTTKLTRPEGGGQHTVSNDAHITLDTNEKKVNDQFEATWSGDIPILTKKGSYDTNQPNLANWKVEYNFGKEKLGNVTLTDTLSDGNPILDTVKIFEVETDIEGNIVSKSDTPISLVPEMDQNGNLVLPNLDAEGKAYLISFSSTVPNGLNEEIQNEITDTIGNKDEAVISVNTIPKGGKVGEQYVDAEGNPYIEWTITLNSNQVDVDHINIKDVFNPDYLDFDVTDNSLYELKFNGTEVDNFSLKDYEHNDGRTGFELGITDAGPKEYQFVYRTYYTRAGLAEPELANSAEIVFDEGFGNGTGSLEPITVSQEGPKAGIEKSGRYVTNESKDEQQIEWTITFNQSKTLLENPSITDTFESGNFEYISGSMVVMKDGTELDPSAYSLEADDKAFTLTLDENTASTYTLTYRTTADDKANANQKNMAELDWQGGKETSEDTVDSRTAGLNKSGEIFINEDGTKSIHWTVNFNTNRNILSDFELVDTNLPSTVDVTNIKITQGTDVDVTNEFTITEPSEGEFSIGKARLDALPYKLTYTTSLSPEEEAQTIKNTADVTYTGGAESKQSTIQNPILSVDKEAVSIKKDQDPDRINWVINANDNSQSQYVNLVNAVLKDTIPTDQRLLADSIKVTRADTDEDITADVTIKTEEQGFEIDLPDGPYEYNIAYQSEIFSYPSNDPVDPNRYTNQTTLINQVGTDLQTSDSADAAIDYFYDGTSNQSIKSGNQNSDTENVDWTATVNPQGLNINDAVITDTFSDNSTYVKGSLDIKNDNDEVISPDLYDLVVADNSFTITFKEGTQLKSTLHLTYSTRLNPSLIGSYEVTNQIQLSGGQEQRTIETTTEETISEQWFYGGGGSGRTVQFELDKRNGNNEQLQGAHFKLERVNIKNDKVLIDSEIVTSEKSVYVSGDIRAGRYILTEVKAPNGFVIFENPIYFTVGYSESGDESYQATLVDANWNPTSDSNIEVAGNKLTVINDYEPVSAALEAAKVLNGNLFIEDEQFEFELVENEKVIDVKKNDKNGKVQFDELTYTATGQHKYQIREVKGTQSGITYDDTVYTVSVNVTTDDTGKLVREIAYNDGPAEFVNSYKAAPTELTFNAKKVLNGQVLKPEQFKFELLNSQGKVLQTATNDKNGEVSFKSLVFEESGVYDYSIREVKGTQGGITYDDSEFRVEATVVDDGDGQLKAAASYLDGPATFTNVYEAEPDQVILSADKILSGQTLSNQQFEFELVNEDSGEVIQTATNNAEGQIIFDALTFNKVGDYAYTIREVQGNLGGVTYDSQSYGVDVSVIDDGEGNLVATTNYVDGPATFKNEYKAAPDQIVIQASKVLNGLELVGEQFTFELVNNEGKVLQTVTNNAEGQIIFETMTYDTAGTYEYVIREVEGSQNGIRYDDKEHIVIVQVEDDGNGQLIATSNITEKPVVFTNSYIPAPDSVVFEAEKRLEGQELRADQFEFELIDANGEVIQTVMNNAEGQVIFEELTFDAVGEYSYTIREVKGLQGGVTYDRNEYEATVIVTDNKEGNLNAEIKYVSDNVLFTNQYAAKDGTAQIQASKILNGQNLTNEQFSFNLLNENKDIIQTATNNEEGSIKFEKISYEKPGSYQYYIEEVNNRLGGITYDGTVYGVTVEVVDNENGQLETTVKYEKEPVFTNEYTAQSDSVTIEAVKQLEGQTLVEDQFKFELVDDNGKVIQTVTNNEKGQIAFEEIIYKEAGSYQYILREVQGDLGGITYDTIEYTVDVKVEDDGKGHLHAEVNYNAEPVFTNQYQADPVSVQLEAMKKLEGQSLREKQFTFELLDSEGTVLQEVKNQADGSIIFEDLQFDEVGEYRYIIREVNDDAEGIVYDSTEYEVLVEIIDDLKGALIAITSLEKQPLVFSNKYIFSGPVDPETSTDSNQKNTEDQKDTLPQTGYNQSQILYTFLGIVSIGLAVLIIKLQKKPK